MATTRRNPSRPIKQSIVQKSRTKKPTSKQLPSINNPNEIKIRFGNNSTQNSMYKPSSILKRKPFERRHSDHFNENLGDWRQPSDLQTIISRPYYSPIHTPPRLRTLITPPGIEPYRNHQSLRGLNTSLPGLDDWHSPPVHLDTWGLDPTDTRFNSNLHLIRRHPSPLSNYGLGTALQKQKKPYIVVPRLTNYLSPPVSSDGARFTLPSRRLSPVYNPDSHPIYIQRIHSFASPRFHREPSDYVYLRQNEAFANHYIDNFIGRCIEDQFIPDILLEIISELDQENKKRGGKSYKTKVDRYYAELNQRIQQEEVNNTHLFSDDWIRELDHKRPPIAADSRVRYYDLPADVQGRLLADINQELIDFEIQNMMTELSTQTLSNRIHSFPSSNDTRRVLYRDTESEPGRSDYSTDHSQRHKKDQIQSNAIENHAQNRLLDTICLDQLILKHIKQNGSVVDADELSRLLDGNILENLIHQYGTLDENGSRTIDNYATRKFHLNSFMNVTMDLLLTELSASLIEDMKDLDEQERRIF